MFLALKMNRTVAELRDSMSNEEFVRWQVYFGRRSQAHSLAAGSER